MLGSVYFGGASRKQSALIVQKCRINALGTANSIGLENNKRTTETMDPNPKTTKFLRVRSKSPSLPLGLESRKLRPELRTECKALQY